MEVHYTIDTNNDNMKMNITHSSRIASLVMGTAQVPRVFPLLYVRKFVHHPNL